MENELNAKKCEQRVLPDSLVGLIRELSAVVNSFNDKKIRLSEKNRQLLECDLQEIESFRSDSQQGLPKELQNKGLLKELQNVLQRAWEVNDNLHNEIETLEMYLGIGEVKASN